MTKKIVSLVVAILVVIGSISVFAMDENTNSVDVQVVDDKNCSNISANAKNELPNLEQNNYKIKLIINGKQNIINESELNYYVNKNIIDELSKARKSVKNIENEYVVLTIEELPTYNIQFHTLANKISDGGSIKIYNIYQQLNTKDDYIGTTGDKLIDLCNKLFNIFIGSYTKWAWKISTLFNLDLSKIKTSLENGDQIRQHYQYAYTYKYYVIDNAPLTSNPSHTDFTNCTAVMTTYAVVNNYLDYYLIKKDSKGISIPVRESKIKSLYFKSNHFDDTDWINKKLSEMYDKKQKYPYSDLMMDSPFLIK